MSDRPHHVQMGTQPSPTREIERRLSSAIAAAVVRGRAELGWSKAEVARRAGVSAATMTRIEAGSGEHVGLRAVCAVLEALGTDARLFLDGPTVLGDRSQDDAVHARLCGHLAGRLSAFGWEPALEVEVGEGRIRGFVDVMAFRPVDRAVICDETKSEVHDAGGIVRTLRWYANHAWGAARDLGWKPARVVPILTVLDSADVAARLRENRTLVDAAFPVRAAELQAWIEDHRAPLAGGFGLAALDPASRRHAWLRATAVDARRVVPPYRNYADFANRGRR
jgi:transcriptional regulator with XRE-family HTH domain